MKTNFKSIVMALAAIMSFTLTSCEEDEFIALTLEGNWKGNMYVSYQFDNISGYHDASYSEVCFLRNPSTYASGDGYWIDYYNDYARYGWGRNYIANHIKWEVFNGNIKIYFVEDNSRVTIYDYSLTNDYFTGYIDLRNGSRQKFSLRHTSSPNWNTYYWGDDNFYYHSNKNNMDIEEDYMNANKVVMDFEDGNDGMSESSDASSSFTQPKRVFMAREY